MTHTKKEIKQAFDNPFVCPSCEARFPNREARQEHWKENDVCDEYQRKGRLAVMDFSIGNYDSLDRWFYEQPKRVLEKGI